MGDSAVRLSFSDTRKCRGKFTVLDECIYEYTEKVRSSPAAAACEMHMSKPHTDTVKIYSESRLSCGAGQLRAAHKTSPRESHARRAVAAPTDDDDDDDDISRARIKCGETERKAQNGFALSAAVEYRVSIYARSSDRESIARV